MRNTKLESETRVWCFSSLCSMFKIYIYIYAYFEQKIPNLKNLVKSGFKFIYKQKKMCPESSLKEDQGNIFNT